MFNSFDVVVSESVRRVSNFYCNGYFKDDDYDSELNCLVIGSHVAARMVEGVCEDWEVRKFGDITSARERY